MALEQFWGKDSEIIQKVENLLAKYGAPVIEINYYRIAPYRQTPCLDVLTDLESLKRIADGEGLEIVEYKVSQKKWGKWAGLIMKYENRLEVRIGESDEILHIYAKKTD